MWQNDMHADIFFTYIALRTIDFREAELLPK